MKLQKVRLQKVRLQKRKLSYFLLPGMMGLLLLGILLFLAACAPAAIPANKQCRQDSDCVPATCCHPKEAVNKDYAPDCQGLLCTQECVPGTIDCGQGEIRCEDRECKVIMK